jgi:hypothetical protein
VVVHGFTDIAARLETLRTEHDWVLVAAPAVLRSSAAADLARGANLLLLVVRPSHVSRKDLTALSREMGTWPRRPVAAIIAAG